MNIKKQISAFHIFGKALKHLQNHTGVADETGRGIMRAQAHMLRESQELEQLLRRESDTMNEYVSIILASY